MKNTEKRSKVQTLYLGATAGIAILILGVATYAWYANNKNVDANVMQFESNTTPNIVINTDPTKIAEIDNDDETKRRTVQETDFYSNLNFDNTPILMPATNVSGSGISSPTGLVTNNDPESVSTASGTGGGLVAVTTGGIGTYYLDYKVYIASADLPMENTSIVANFTTAAAVDLEGNTYLKAASVDLYSATISSISAKEITVDSSTYKGTLNLADMSKKVTVFNQGTIPATYDSSIAVNDQDSQGKDYICVVMRFYFDGALQDPATNTCYVRSSNLCTTDLGVSVHFKAQENTTSKVSSTD